MTEPTNRIQQLFDLSGRVAIVTGGAGLLGYHHGAILAAAGVYVVLLDLIADPAMRAKELMNAHGIKCLGLAVDITDEASLKETSTLIIQEFGRIDILINNAANNPKMEDGTTNWTRLENLPLNWMRTSAWA